MQQTTDLRKLNHLLEPLTAEERIAHTMEMFGDEVVLTSSFGIQAAVCLHMVTRIKSDVPVVFIDTGYLFPETYQFVDELTDRLSLNLQVYRSAMSPAWQEARYGQLWEQGLTGLERYHQITKVEPMSRALDELAPTTWIAGLRRQQSETRRNLGIIERQSGHLKLHPIIDWSSRQVHEYLTANQLPYHPLWNEGYVSVGDVHSTRPLSPGMTDEETRHLGLKRECGIHEPEPCPST